MLNKYRRFSGGYVFRPPERLSGLAIKDAPFPEKVTLPLKLRFGSTIKPLVAKGDRVKAGQIIARDDETISAPAVASLSGIVEDLVKIDYFYGKVDAVVIQSDGTSGYLKLEAASRDYANLSSKKISELIYLSGAASLGKSGIPTVFKSSPARPKSIDNLVVTTFSTGPFSLNEKTLFADRQNDFYHGLCILKRALPNIKISIVVDKKDRFFTEAIVDAIRRGSTATKVPDWIFIQPLAKKYPQESEDMLARMILNKKIPLGGLGVDIGMLVLDIHDLLRVYEAVALGKPLIERTVALTGSACKEDAYINFRIGTRLEDILRNNLKDDIEPRPLLGAALTGIMQKDLLVPVGRSIGRITVLAEQRGRQFLAFLRPGSKKDSYSRAFLSSYIPKAKRNYNTNMHGELRPCIQCGYCQEVCPVDIIPHLLSKQIKHDICEGAERLGIFDCIDCGLCSYVCPCKIPLADDIASGKKKLIEEGCPINRVKVKESEEAVKSYRGRMPL